MKQGISESSTQLIVAPTKEGSSVSSSQPELREQKKDSSSSSPVSMNTELISHIKGELKKVPSGAGSKSYGKFNSMLNGKLVGFSGDRAASWLQTIDSIQREAHVEGEGVFGSSAANALALDLAAFQKGDDNVYRRLDLAISHHDKLAQSHAELEAQLKKLKEENVHLLEENAQLKQKSKTQPGDLLSLLESKFETIGLRLAETIAQSVVGGGSTFSVRGSGENGKADVAALRQHSIAVRQDSQESTRNPVADCKRSLEFLSPGRILFLLILEHTGGYLPEATLRRIADELKTEQKSERLAVSTHLQRYLKSPITIDRQKLAQFREQCEPLIGSLYRENLYEENKSQRSSVTTVFKQLTAWSKSDDSWKILISTLEPIVKSSELLKEPQFAESRRKTLQTLFEHMMRKGGGILPSVKRTEPGSVETASLKSDSFDKDVETLQTLLGRSTDNVSHPTTLT
jgi:hypothetical protein